MGKVIDIQIPLFEYLLSYMQIEIDITYQLMIATSSDEPVEQLGVPVDPQEF